jgi:radical SAM superfamily enzyme YgiQ (UPF0313 family)
MLGYSKVKVLLVALNARYVHTNLAVRYLREVLLAQGMTGLEVGIREFSINERVNSIAGEIYEEKPDMLGFSCYIWNISQIGSLIRSLRPVMPEARFFAGGPEVSYDPEDILCRFPELDAVVSGEAENSLPALIKAWQAGQLPTEVGGLVWRGKVTGQGADFIVTNEKGWDFPDLNQCPIPMPRLKILKAGWFMSRPAVAVPLTVNFVFPRHSRYPLPGTGKIPHHLKAASGERRPNRKICGQNL